MVGINYNGNSVNYNKRTNTYSRPPVKVSYPCGHCKQERPSEWTKTGLKIHQCPCKEVKE